MDAILLDVPDRLTTERLLLRAARAGDGVEVNQAIHDSFERLRQWMHWATYRPEAEETEAFERQAEADFLCRSQFTFNAFLRDAGPFIGSIALFNIDWSVPKLEIGYWLRTGYEGRGLMTEAVAALVDLAFATLAMHRVEIRCDPRNQRSAAIPERLGFALEGVLRNEKRTPQGTLRDTAVYARISPERG